MRVFEGLTRKDYTLFLTDQGDVFGCGSTSRGKLATLNDGTRSIAIPILVGTKNPKFTNMLELRAGDEHSVGLRLESKLSESGEERMLVVAYTFGDNSSGVPSAQLAIRNPEEPGDNRGHSHRGRGHLPLLPQGLHRPQVLR